MTTDLETTIEYYKDLLLYQYINLPKARAHVGLLCSQALIDLLPIDFNNAFDLDTAVGDQLDILGEYIGFDRIVSIAPSRTYFTFNDIVSPTAGSTIGFTSHNSATLNRNYYFYSYIQSGGIATALIDDEYRLLLKIKLVNNISQNSLYEITALLYEYFSTDIILIDQLDMSMSYFVKSNIENIITIAYNEGLIPKPMGVNISGIFIADDISLLWDLSSSLNGHNSTKGFSNHNLFDDNKWTISNLTTTYLSGSANVNGNKYGTIITIGDQNAICRSFKMYIQNYAGSTGSYLYGVITECFGGIPSVVSNIADSIPYVIYDTDVPSGQSFVEFVFSKGSSLYPPVLLEANKSYAISVTALLPDSFFSLYRAGTTGNPLATYVYASNEWVVEYNYNLPFIIDLQIPNTAIVLDYEDTI